MHVRRDLRNLSLACWYRMRLRRFAAGGIDMEILKRWIAADFVKENMGVSVGLYVVAPAEYDIVIDEPAERELWSSWGAILWLVQLHSETDALDRLGFLFYDN